MKNPNSPFERSKAGLLGRWFHPDFPGGEPRFQLPPFGKDIGLFILFPVACVVLANSGKVEGKKRSKAPTVRHLQNDGKEELKPQIVTFGNQVAPVGSGVAGKRAPGTLIRVRLLNAAESLGETPIHVRVLDESLGREFYGGSLIGDGSVDANYSRMNVNFRFAKRRDDNANAFTISARALSLDGTLGLNAVKKEGMFARGAIGGAASGAASLGNASGSNQSLQAILFQALTKGLASDFGTEAGVAKNRANVMALDPGVEFFAELKDFFPSGGK